VSIGLFLLPAAERRRATSCRPRPCTEGHAMRSRGSSTESREAKQLSSGVACYFCWGRNADKFRPRNAAAVHCRCGTTLGERGRLRAWQRVHPARPLPTSQCREACFLSPPRAALLGGVGAVLNIDFGRASRSANSLSSAPLFAPSSVHKPRLVLTFLRHGVSSARSALSLR